MPQIRSTQTAGVPVWVKGSLVLVAQGMVIQSVAQVVPTLLPSAGVPPVMLKDMAGVLTRIEKKSSSIILNVRFFKSSTCIGTSSILYSTKVPVHPHANGVVSIGQL